MANDLLIYGAGYLGSRIARLWTSKFPDSFVQSVTSRSPLVNRKFANVIYCVPPGQADAVNAAINAFDQTGKLMVVSSTGVYAEEHGGVVSESSPLASSPRAIELLEIENLFIKNGGAVVRLAGLYGEGRGPHLYYLRRKNSEKSSTGLINLIHIDDAAEFCVQALIKGVAGSVYLGSDGSPISRAALVKASGGVCHFTGINKNNLGKRVDGHASEKILGVAPRWTSFLNWVRHDEECGEGRRLEDFSSYVVAVKKKIPTREAAFFLHGFPANRSGKNLDIALAVNGDVGLDTFIIHYRGLGASEGFFSFSHSISESVKTARAILDFGRYQRLHIYGHSWGSVVASQVALDLKNLCASLILACPLTKLDVDDPVLTGLVVESAKELPRVFGDQSFETVRQDLLDLIGKRASPWDIAPLMDPKTTRVSVIQALNDLYTPPEKTKLFLNRFQEMPTYVELDLDHSFLENRSLLCNTVSALLKKSVIG